MEFHDTRILIADENTHQRALLREALNRGGYRYVEEAAGGEDALAKIDRTHPDVAIIDIYSRLPFKLNSPPFSHACLLAVTFFLLKIFCLSAQHARS